MFSWGITLMVIGALSFVLPVMGRQFIIVSALGLTGVSSAVLGVALFFIGLALFNSATKKETHESVSDRNAKKRASEKAALIDSELRKYSVDHSSSEGEVTTKSIGNRRAFYFASKGAVPPVEYGIYAIKIALDGSEQALKEIVGNNESDIQQAISKASGPVQLHLLALQAAVFYVCADKLCSSKGDVLGEVSDGIQTGFSAVFNDSGSTSKEPRIVQFLYELFQEYAYSLAKELNDNSNENPFDMGATANLVTEYIGKQCGMHELIAKNPLEKVRIELVTSAKGIKLLASLLVDKSISYIH